jgi:hypothetical protein
MMKANFLIVFLLASTSAQATCPRETTMVTIFEHLQSGAKLNIDGQVWQVEQVTPTSNFSEASLVTVIATSDNLGGRCSYDAIDRSGDKLSFTLGSRQKMQF